MTKKWNQRFLELAKTIGLWSKDPSTQVGSVLVDDEKNILSVGFNGFPRGVKDDINRYINRDLKYKMICHAEANAVAAAARNGHSLKGAILYSTAMPCCQCTVLILQAGVKEIVFATNSDYETRWAADLKVSWEMCREVGVGVTRFV